MIKNIITTCTFLAFLILFSCSPNDNYKEVAAGSPEEEMIDNESPKKVESIERKIIKEGEISFETADVKKTKSLITKTVDELDGYIANDNIYDYQDRIEHRLVIRIVAKNFDELLAKISESVEKLDSRNISVLDVTEEYIDVEARIKTKKELENRYKELLKKAATVKDILNIEREIGTLREEIESVEGRLRYLKDKISFSTLTVTYYEKTSSVFGFSSKFGEGIKGGWDNLLWMIIGLTHVWPFILAIAVILFIVIRLDRKRKKK